MPAEIRCPSCKKIPDDKYNAAGSPRRKCDGCDRIVCRHMASHTPPDHDLCGPCKLAAKREAKKADAGDAKPKPDDKKKDEATP